MKEMIVYDMAGRIDNSLSKNLIFDENFYNKSFDAIKIDDENFELKEENSSKVLYNITENKITTFLNKVGISKVEIFLSEFEKQSILEKINV
jgi:hypothetical protein